MEKQKKKLTISGKPKKTFISHQNFENKKKFPFSDKKFSKKQIQSIVWLSKKLIRKYKINAKNILGHSDIAPTRKKDPGEKFPWKEFAKQKLQ